MTGVACQGANAGAPPPNYGARSPCACPVAGDCVPACEGTHKGCPYYLTVLNRFSISAQLTTFHQAAMYSARRFWYLR